MTTISTRRVRRIALGAAAAGVLAIGSTAAAQPEQTGTLTPIGGGYPDTFPGFLEAALPYVQTLDTDRFYILMMPMSFTYDVEVLTTTDLIDNSLAIERRRRQLERACTDAMAEAALDLECQVVVPPVYTREAAEDALILDYFTDDLAAVYFVGGDQTFAMQILNGTPLEGAISDAFARGVVMGGNSAGAAITSRTMIGGYTSEDLGVNDQLREGAIDLWNTDDRRGLPFGLSNLIVEQHYFQYSRVGRLINALVQSGDLTLGLGVDGFTGAVVRDEATIGDVFGAYSVGIVDLQSLQAVGTARYVEGVLSIRNVLFHTLAPGGSVYDIATRSHSLAAAPRAIGRTFQDALTLPEGAGTLTLLGNSTVSGLPEVDERTLVILTGYADEAAQGDIALLYTDSAATVVALTGDEPIDTSGFTTVIVHAGDQSLIDVAALEPVREAWLAGANLVLDNAAAAIAGPSYSAHAPIDYDNDDDAAIEAAEQGSFLVGETTIAPGLGLIGAAVEPRVIDNTRWGRVVSLAWNAPETPVLAIPDEAGVQITAEGAQVIGDNGVFVFDFSAATLGVGENDAFEVANGLIDIFAPTELIAGASLMN
jgi:cyanophycinase